MVTFLLGGKLTYYIPAGIADDTFTIDAMTGTVITSNTLDHERQAFYLVPIYVMDSIRNDNSSITKPQFDVTILLVTIIDVNDHAPRFHQGSCSSLSIPENNDLSVIHTVCATDLDSGNNGEITYSITGE